MTSEISSTVSKSFRHARFSNFLSNLLPIQPETGSADVFFSMKPFFEADLRKHALYLIGNLSVAILLVTSGVKVHLVRADANLFHAQEIDYYGPGG
jgi:hypothetical protein